MNKLIILFLVSFACPVSQLSVAHANAARLRRAEVDIYFSQSSSKISDKSAAELDRFAATLDSILADDRISAVEITGSSSIDGPESYNLRLSGDRASALFLYLFNDLPIDHSLISFESLGENWQGLHTLTAASESVPSKARALEIIGGDASPANKESALRALDKGSTWRFLVSDIFPRLRYASVTVSCENHPSITQTVEFEEPDVNLKALSTPPPMPVCCIVA